MGAEKMENNAVIAGKLKVKDVMSRNVVMIGEEDSISSVLECFERHKISGAPVINQQGEYVGVVTNTDIANFNVLLILLVLLKGQMEMETVSLQVKEAMNQGKPMTVDENLPVEDAGLLMSESHVHRLFAVNKKAEIVGVVSSLDLVKAMSRQMKTSIV